MKEIEKQNCTLCKYSKKNQGQNEFDKGVLQCYRFPPVRGTYIIDTDLWGYTRAGIFYPEVTEKHWCHEFKKCRKKLKEDS